MLARHIFRLQKLSRGLATHAESFSGLPAALHLKSGETFKGKSFGAPRSLFGETVFSTSITSCGCFIFSMRLICILSYLKSQTPNL